MMSELDRRAKLAAVSESVDADAERLSIRPDDPTQFVRALFADENPYAPTAKPCECKRVNWDKHARRDFILRRTCLMLELGYGISGLKASKIIAGVSAEIRNSMRQAETIRQIWGRRDKGAWEVRAVSLVILGQMIPDDTQLRTLPLSERQALVKKRAEY